MSYAWILASGKSRENTWDEIRKLISDKKTD